MYIFILLPVMGALIGWGTNLLAIRSLFRPVQPVKIYGTGFSFQGLIPKRKLELAHSIGSIVEKELVSWSGLVTEIDNGVLADEILSSVEDFVDVWVTANVPGLVPKKLKEMLRAFVLTTVSQEFRRKLPDILHKLATSAEAEVHIGKMVEEKIANMTLEGLEEMVFRVAGKELKQIEILGALLGLFIGLMQAGLVYFLGIP